MLAHTKAAVYRWNEGTGKIEELSLAKAGQPIYAAVGGMFDSAVPAEESWWNSDSCFWLYYMSPMSPTQFFPELAPDKFILAKFTWDRALAEEQLDACNPAGDGFVAELTDFPAPWRPGEYSPIPAP